MYSVNSLLIAGVLFATMAIAIEVGNRIGGINRKSASESTKTHVNAIQASVLGVLALLLGFTFSLALQRFDSRSEAVVEEANAIGTTYLRARLLPTSVRSEVQKLLHRYVNFRVEAGAVSLVSEPERQALVTQANQVLDVLWECARQAAEEAPNPVTSGLFIQSLNDTIDAFGRRDAALSRHVPEIIWFLLFGTLLLTGGVVGYSSGVAGHRAPAVTFILVLLIVVLTFVIIDLDRPRRGLIQVDQTSFLQLQAAITAHQTTATEPMAPSGRPPATITGCH